MSLALYRKYRPAAFGELVGQEHVSAPLIQALKTGRTHHAYLFSGPRGCGKTSSARILARSLNCEKGPTPEPCGECDSCVALAPSGPGSLDVIEIDAASHNGVDDARDLRERAFFAPVSSRFKIYIIDEAHMVTSAAFNALLKVVEEPPPHVCFIFATTEPERVLPTIKSRTFHYRFRLIAPTALRDHLAAVCELEGIKADPLVLGLVVRAGAGSARDAMSVLDQLAAGAPDGLISYDAAIAALGFTDAALLDEVVDAFAAGDGASIFASIDRVIEAGLDPRRFAQDTLERLRDLLVFDAVPDAGESGLLDYPADVLDRMRGQAARFGRAGLSRAADVMATALIDMRGTTSPRLVLELASARILLPGASSDQSALLARLDRLEKRMAVGGPVAAPAPVAAQSPAPQAPASAADSTPPATDDVEPAAAPGLSQPADMEPLAEPVEAPAVAAEPLAVPAAVGAFDATAMRRVWDDVLAAVRERSRVAHMILNQYAQVGDVDAKTVTLVFSPASLASQFEDKAEFFREALQQVVGVDLIVKTAPASTDAAPGSNPGDFMGVSAQPASEEAAAPPVAPPPVIERDDVSESVDIDDNTAGKSAEDAAIALLQDGLGAREISEG